MDAPASPTSQAAEHGHQPPSTSSSQTSHSTSARHRKPYGKPLGKTRSSMLRMIVDTIKDARALQGSHSMKGDKRSQRVTSAVAYAVSKWRPASRRLKSTWAFVVLYAFFAWVLLLNIVGLFIPGFNVLLLMYWAYIHSVDKQTSSNSGRPWRWLKKLSYWTTLAEYFPMRLHQVQALDPEKTYVFGYHPHGIISMGAAVCFATNACGFEEKFPGIDIRVLTLRFNFLVPFFRELLLCLGICDVSKQSIQSHLARGSGSAVMIVVGGAAESLCASSGDYTLTLKNRKGFVKLALKTGASLVPVFSFGETDLFDMTSSKGVVAKIQQTMKKALGFTIPLFYGKGIWLARGLLPYQNPVHVVVGRAIDLPQVDEPTQEQIDLYHGEYVESLIQLYNDNKKSVGMSRKHELRII